MSKVKIKGAIVLAEKLVVVVGTAVIRHFVRSISLHCFGNLIKERCLSLLFWSRLVIQAVHNAWSDLWALRPWKYWVDVIPGVLGCPAREKGQNVVNACWGFGCRVVCSVTQFVLCKLGTVLKGHAAFITANWLEVFVDFLPFLCESFFEKLLHSCFAGTWRTFVIFCKHSYCFPAAVAAPNKLFHLRVGFVKAAFYRILIF